MKVFAIIVLFFVVTSSPQGIKSKYLLIRLRENAGNPRKSNHPQAIGRSLFRSDKSGEQAPWCCQQVIRYNVQKGISWGSAPSSIRSEWDLQKCNLDNDVKKNTCMKVKADYKFIGGCEKGEECVEGIYCGDTDNHPVCNHCSFNECKENAMKNQTYAFAYKLRNTEMKKGWCKLCNDKEFSKFEKGTDDGHKGWGLYAKKETGIKETWPCGDAHECQCGLKCEDKNENGYGTCKRNWSDDNCYWLGSMPFCNPDECRSGSIQVLRNSNGGGVGCLSGTYRWCCRNCKV